jgi:hypothetical protein
MCKAIDFANGINEQITEAKEYYNKLRIKQSVFDGVEQDILHKIENLDKFSLYDGWKFCMSLSKLRKTRRKTKNEVKTMQLLINQLGEFEIKDTTINKEVTTLEELTNKKTYHKRQLDITGDILEEVDDIINNIDHKSVVIKEEIIDKSNEDKLYEIQEALPKIKGSTIKVKYKSVQQKNHLLNSVGLSYKRYIINEKEKYVELIDRKRSK